MISHLEEGSADITCIASAAVQLLARTTHTDVSSSATGSCVIFLTFLLEEGDEIMEYILRISGNTCSTQYNGYVKFTSNC